MKKSNNLWLTLFLAAAFFIIYLIFLLANNDYVFFSNDWRASFEGTLRKFGYFDDGGFSVSKGLHPISIFSYSYGVLGYLHQALRVLLYKYEIISFTEGSYRTYEGVFNFLLMAGLFYILYKNYGFNFAFLFILFSSLLPRELSYQRAHGFIITKVLIMMVFIYLQKYLEQEKMKNIFILYLSLILIYYNDSLAKIYFLFFFVSFTVYLFFIKEESLASFLSIINDRFLKGYRKYFILAFVALGSLLIIFNYYYRDWLIVGGGYKFRGLLNHINVKASSKDFVLNFNQHFDLFKNVISGTNFIYSTLVIFSLFYSVYLFVTKKVGKYSIILIYSFLLFFAFYFQIAFYSFSKYPYSAQLDKSYYLYFPATCIIVISLCHLLEARSYLFQRGVLLILFISMVYFTIPVVDGTAKIPKPYGVPVKDKGYKAAAYLYKTYFEDQVSKDVTYTNIANAGGPAFYFDAIFNSYEELKPGASLFFYEKSSANEVDLNSIEADFANKVEVINDDGALIVIYYNDKSIQLKESYYLEELNSLFNGEYNTIEKLFKRN